jgi:hypothetical protein
MSSIAGIGWIDRAEYGCVRRRLRRPCSGLGSLRSTLQEESIFSYPVKGFSKYDRVSKMTCCAMALALSDAGMAYSEDRKQDIGIVGTNSDGCLQSNLAFFDDYVKNGRTLGRANLFVYTLPSIPVAEAAIHFKCQGPLLYLGFPGSPVASLLREADRMIQRGEAEAMVAVRASEQDAQCFILRRGDEAATEPLLTLEQVAGMERRASSPRGVIEELLRL